MLGEESLTKALSVDRLSSRRTRFVYGIGGKLEELFGGKCVVPDVQRRELGEDLSGICPRSNPGKSNPHCIGSILRCGLSVRRHRLNGRSKRMPAQISTSRPVIWGTPTVLARTQMNRHGTGYEGHAQQNPLS